MNQIACLLLLSFWLGFTLSKAEKPLQDMELQEKEEKYENHVGKLLERTQR